MKTQILVVDDEKNVRRSLKLALEDAGHEVALAEHALAAVESLRAKAFDLVILDIRLGEISGLQLLERIRGEGFSAPVLFISGNASLSEAAETLRRGAADFLEKPFSPEQLQFAVTRALRIGELERRLATLARAGGAEEMIGESAPARALWETIRRVAPTKSKVLIQGESGTGKELIARALHKLSGSYAKGPFVKVNCAAIPPELIESELFGHERGAFTGAAQLKRGLFELAHGGTLFLDEIGEMSLAAQAKVLRVLQAQELTRVGGSTVIRVDVRVIAATHRDLAVEVKQGRFREDLYFRINVVPLRSTPLRERRSDIPALTVAFIRECCRENGFSPKEISAEAVEALSRYDWPGNIRELKNLCERLVIFSGERIERHDLPGEWKNEGAASRIAEVRGGELSFHEFKQRAERNYLVATLKKTAGNISQAAKLLDLERTYLHRKITEHQIAKREYF